MITMRFQPHLPTTTSSLLLILLLLSSYSDGFSNLYSISSNHLSKYPHRYDIPMIDSHRRTPHCLFATVEQPPQEQEQEQITAITKEAVLQAWKDDTEYSDMMDVPSGFFALVDAIKTSRIALGLRGTPFVLKREEILQAITAAKTTTTTTTTNDHPFDGFFSMKDLEKAVEDDFLDASRGSTDNRKGWKITTVSNPRGDSFEEARMTYQDVLDALEKGTVIFNAAGAHIPKLAGPCLAVTDAAATPNALNLYITAAGKRTSAPPHTDKQDVIVMQTSGSKFWRVFAPTDPKKKPMADLFARGKGDDDLPLYTLKESGKLLLETTLNAGDVLFVPGGLPHTTATSLDGQDETSLHLTFNIDTHVWDLDYLSARRLALRRACVADTALGQSREEDNRYVGKVNELPTDVHKDLFEILPLGFLDENPTMDSTIETVTTELKRIAKATDLDTYNQVEDSIWAETIQRLHEHGMELLDIHRDMYISAMEEGRTREAEDAMTAHLDTKRKTLSPERMQRLSLFRVQRHYEKINSAKDKLVEWSYSGKPQGDASEGTTTLPENWAYTMPVKVGDQVEADLGGAFFPATVSRATGGTYDVKFFDGDQESGLDRSMIKLLKPPDLAEDDTDTSNMTPKQLKRWKKQQEKKNKKQG